MRDILPMKPLVLFGLLCAGVAGILPVAPVMAERLDTRGLPPSDPILAESETMAGPNRFFLNSDQDVEVVRFKRIHDIQLCAAQPDPNAIGSARHGYPLAVHWDDETGIIMPGNCLSFDAQRVKIRAASTLPQDVILTGTVKVLR